MPEWRIAPKSDGQNRSKKDDCFPFLGGDDTSPLSNITKYYEKMKENWKRAKISSKKVPANTCNFRIAAV